MRHKAQPARNARAADQPGMVLADLIRSNDTYREFYEDAPDMCSLVDVSTMKLIDCNNTMVRITGYAKEELVGRHVSTLHPEEWHDQIAELGQSFFATGEVRGYELELVRKDGSKIWVSLSVVGVQDPAGNYLYSRCILRDITEGKLAAEALRRSEDNQLQLARESAALADISRIISSSLDVQQVFDNFASELKSLVDFCRMNVLIVNRDGQTYTTKYLYGDPIPGRNIGDALSLSGTQTGAVVLAGKTMVGDVDGGPEFPIYAEYRRLGIRSTITVPLVVNGKIIGSLGLRSRKAAAYGVREREMLEQLAAQIAPAIENARLYEESLETQRALRESEQRNRAFLEALPDPMFIIGPGNVYLDCNSREDASREGMHQVLGRRVADVLPEPAASLTTQHIQRALESRQPQIFEYSRPGPEECSYFEARVVACGESEALAIVRDITERKQAEDRIKETGRLASLGELAAGVAHEINNPLTSILGFISLVLEEDLPPHVREDLERISLDAQRTARIVQNLLSFARKREPERRFINLSGILERAVELKSYDFRTGNIQVNLELDPDLPDTMADEHQLFQVVMNLLTNAEQAMKSAHGRGNLTVSAGCHGGRIRLGIIDDGPGIAPENRHKIFQPFYTTKEVGVGTGLGLSICYGIVHQHDGNIWVESTPGNGAAFFIDLPVHDVASRPQSPEGQPEQLESPMKHLLVVDDEPNVRDLLVKCLSRDQYTVDLAQDGAEALSKLGKVSYDCVITDLKMPGVSGPELFRRMKRSHPRLARNTIFITGDTVGEDSRAFVQSVTNPVLEKPFQVEDLRWQIRLLLEQQDQAP